MLIIGKDLLESRNSKTKKKKKKKTRGEKKCTLGEPWIVHIFIA
jgi:hypothetical protein